MPTMAPDIPEGTRSVIARQSAWGDVMPLAALVMS